MHIHRVTFTPTRFNEHPGRETHLIFMRVPCHQDVNVELSPHDGERVQVTPRNDCVAVAEADFELPDLYDSRRHKSVNFVKVALDSMDIWGDRFEIFQH